MIKVPEGMVAAEGARRVPELDGLRGFAILIVVLLHYFYKPGATAPPNYQHFQAIFRLGWTGVDLFFVLSGFLIGGILLNAKNSPGYFKAFYIRRFFRIIPIYYLWIIAYILLVGIGGNTLRAHMHSGLLPPLSFDVYEHFLFLQNIRFPGYMTLFLTWFGVTWSLAVEEQFYLVSPFLIRFLSETKLMVVLVLVIIGSPMLRTYFYLHEEPLPYHAYLATYCRGDALAFGVLTAMLWRREGFRNWLAQRRQALNSAFLVFLAGMAALWYWGSNPYHWLTITVGLSWIGIFYALLLLLALVHPSGPIATWARARWLRELGRVSYCVYLIHLAVAYFCFGLTTRTIPHVTSLGSLAFTIFCAALTYFMARLSWRYIEDPLVRIGHRTSYGNRMRNA
jgi:peptidoglycan/LPS O-acetylase OafA/YrhL